MSDKSFKGHMAILGANVTFGLMSPISKALLNSGVINPFAVTMLRMVGAGLAFWIASLFMPREKVARRDLLLLFFAAFFGLMLNQGSFVLGVSLTSPIDASIVTTTTPIITMLIAALYLKEPVTGKKVLGIVVGAAGALLLILNSHRAASSGGGNNLLGDLLCLLAQISFATYYVVFKDLIGRYSAVTLMKWMFLYAVICYVPLTYREFLASDFAAFTPLTYLQIAFVVFGATFFAYLLLPIGQKRLRPTVASMYNYVQPLVASLVAVLWGMDTFGPIKIVAVALVFLGVYVVTQSKSKAQRDAELAARQQSVSKSE